MENVNDFADSFEDRDVKRGVGNIVKRAECCIEAHGGSFEYKLKKYRSRGSSS